MKSLILGLLFLAASAAEDVQVTGSVDRNQVGVGDVINFTVSVSSKSSIQVDEPRLAGLEGFELINTSSGVETRSAFENGRFVTEQSRNFTYLLAVAKKGTLTIPPITVHVDGKGYNTQPIQIAVSGERKVPPQAQRQAPDPFQQLDDMEELFNQMLQRRFRGAPPGAGQGQQQPPVNPDDAFFIHAVADKTKVYVGEQVVANFYLYTRGQIRDIDTLKYPDLKGFWKEDLEMATRLNFEQVVENGVAYQRALLVSYALFPIKAGKATVDSYRAKCTVLTPSNFGFGRPYVFTKASKPIELEVMEIPAAGRPSEFTGAVGRFRLNASFEPLTGATGQPVTLRVRIEGIGNAKLIELPKLNFPPSFELYDQKNQAKYLKDGSSFKEFEVLFLPREPGVFDIPPIGISTFDPESKKFAHVESQAMRLTVTGPGGTGAAVPPQAAGGQTPAADQGPQLPALAMDLGGGVLATTAAPAFTLLLYLVVFGFLGHQGWTKFRRKPKKANLGLMLKRRLIKVRDLSAAKKWRLMGVEGTNAIYFILGQLSEQGGANQDLEKMLEFTPPSLRNELAAPLKDILSRFEALSFAPEKLIEEMTEKSKIQKMIEQLEKTLLRAIELSEI
jgi:hypothetical protein